MVARTVILLGMMVAGITANVACAQAPAAAANPLDVVPDKMPFDIPYGTPISLERANAAIAAAVAEARKHDWKMNVAVVDSGGNLVAFQRMDGAQVASVDVSQHKARASAKYRRETKVFENGIRAAGAQLPDDARRGHRIAGRNPPRRGRQVDRRHRLFRRSRFAGRSKLQGRRGDHQIGARAATVCRPRWLAHGPLSRREPGKTAPYDRHYIAVSEIRLQHSPPNDAASRLR